MGFEGVNVIFDSWVYLLMMGLEEYLLLMFCDDFEFNDEVVVLYLYVYSLVIVNQNILVDLVRIEFFVDGLIIVLDYVDLWISEVEQELKKVLFFVCGKV